MTTTLTIMLDAASTSSTWPELINATTNSSLLDVVNRTLSGNSEQSTPHVSPIMQALITFFYLFGIGGNIAALIMLGRSETQRNRRQSLMLRCLAWNDLLALLCSCTLMYLQLYMEPNYKWFTDSRFFCGLRVFVRTFGLGSGSVAIVMAIERCLSLTRPFLYQRHVTFRRIWSSVFGLWAVVVVLVCLPFMGFGLYWDEDKQKCERYRKATQPADIAYAYLYFAFGLLMCLCITSANLAVIAVLCRLRRGAAVRRSTTRRVGPDGRVVYSPTTRSEISFAKLMAVLCIFFVVCWLPQLVVVVMSLAAPNANGDKAYRLADMGIALNFALNPYVYVLTRRQTRRAILKLIKPLYQSNSGQPCGRDGQKGTRTGNGTEAELDDWDSSRDVKTTVSVLEVSSNGTKSMPR